MLMNLGQKLLLIFTALVWKQRVQREETLLNKNDPCWTIVVKH